MSGQWPKVRLGEVLHLDLERVPIDPSVSYPMVGVLSFGRGLFDREPIENGKTSYKYFNRLKAEHVVMSQLFGWEGALALSSHRFAGKFLSPQFPTFLSDRDKLDREFLGWVMRRPALWEDLASRASGMGDRRRTLNPDALFACEIPLPPLAEQHRIVARIEELAAQIHETRALRLQATSETNALRLHVAADLFPEGDEGVVGDFVRFQTGYAFKSDWFTESGIRLARNANIGHGVLDWSDTVRIPAERRAEFPRFELECGDILVALDRPIISTGVKVAQVRTEDLPSLLLQRVARAQFQNGKVIPAYFFRWLQSPHFANAIDPGRSNGVPHISHKDIEKIPFAPPAIGEQRRIVAELDALQVAVDALKRHQADTAAELDALLPAILDRAFRGEI